LWEIVETKLVTEGLVRYLSESQCANLIYALAVVGKGSDALFEKLDAEVRLHYLAMETEDLEAAMEGLELSGRGNAKTFETLSQRLREAQPFKIPE
jgi:O-methyltransferase involved in polyketide biosynthesis